ncbi:MAG: acyl-ACP--UDP-N-acetylglucosamine O-acyltransferase [Bacteroidales bacterium]|jgi:UDP-N-acetylglucosamine acyltransferase|nr:acyl-ACP--UDP-N-acetylglucosamine O-acyltransferase [Bacteroidales bacterium]
MHQPLAYVHPQARIAKNVVIEPFVTIEQNVEIGEGTWIGPNVTIMEGARIGKNCKIFPGSVISASPQDLKFIGEETTAVIGDNTTIRECVTINRGTKANWETRVGSNCLLMAYVHLGHDSVIGDNCILANNATLAGHVIVDDWAILNGFCAVQQFIHIGSHTYVAGATLVRKDVPPFTKAAREPISYVGINSVGLRRRGFSNEQIEQIQNIYRYIYLRKLNVTNAIQLIETELKPTAERDEILSFITNTKVGIMRGIGKEEE